MATYEQAMIKLSPKDKIATEIMLKKLGQTSIAPIMATP